MAESEVAGKALEQRDRAEPDLVEQELTRFKLGIERSGEAVFMTTVDGEIIYANPAFEELYGFSREDWQGETPRILKSGRLSPRVYEDFWRALLAGEVVVGELVNKTKDGRLVTVQSSSNPILTQDGQILGFLAIQRDISAQKEAEDELRAGEMQLQAAQRLAHIGSWSWDVATDAVTWSKELYAINGLDPELPAPGYAEMSAFYTVEGWAMLSRAVERAVRTGEPYNLELEFVRRDGTVRWSRARGEPVQDEEGRISGLHGTLQDITERKRAEAALVEREQWLRDSQRVGRIGTYSLDIAAGVWRSSDVLDEIFGIDLSAERTVESWNALIHPGEQAEMLDYFVGYVVGRRRPFDKEYRVVRANDREERWVWGRGELVFDDSGNPIKMIGTIQDVTERKRAEEALQASEAQLRHNQRMEAVGSLAGGIAHDFNNLLTPIIGCSEILLADPNMDDDARQDLVEILTAAQRAATLTRQLLAFSRRQPLRPRVLDPNVIVNGMSGLLRRLLGEDVVLATELDLEPWTVEVDPAQLEQVIMNLAVNARDAMPGGGRLTITTTNRALDAAFVEQHPSIKPGRHVMLAVGDTGHGMDEETLARIFDPFFTTKGPGRGTGLGLSTVEGIVKQSGGAVTVTSAPGMGSTFSIYVPAVDAAATAPIAEALATAAPGVGSETILVVEDEASVRALAARVLRRQGYTVYEAETAAEALNLLARVPRVDLLLTDVVLEGVGGSDLAEAARGLEPRLKVLFMSGYAHDAVVLSGRLRPGITLLEKPFTMDALACGVREVLDREA